MVDPAPGRADQAATAVTAIQRDIILLTMERRDGQITVRRWAKGVKGEEIAPGLALDEAPEVVRGIMTGATTVEALADDQPDAVIRGRMGRVKAFRTLRKLTKETRRRTAAS